MTGLNEAQLEYLESIDMELPLINKVADSLNILSELCPEPIETIFVSEYLNGDGAREYEYLEAFSSSYNVSARLFGELEYTVAAITNKVIQVTVTTTSYNFDRAKPASRLYIRAHYEHNLVSEFKASGMNCAHLKAVLAKYIKPNFTK